MNFNCNKSSITSPLKESLVAGGSIDELTGTLISALMSGEPKDKILDIFFRAARGMLTPEQFEPDLSVLPKGVYPGQKMYFVHVENLGLGKSKDLWRSAHRFYL